MIKTRLTQRTAFRLAALVAAIISLTNLVIFSVLFFAINSQLNENLKAHVEEVRRTLADVEVSGGFEGLAAMVNRHAQVAQSNEDIYLLTDSADQYVAGNIRVIPRFPGWKTIPWHELPLIGAWTAPRASTAVVGRWTTIKNGFLFVGDGNGDINDAQRVLLKGLLWGIGLSILSAMIGGYILGMNAQKRIAKMEGVLGAVASGQLQERVPRSPSADDLDHVAALINATLDRLQALIGNLRQVSTDIAHDLRTPIARMRQKLEVVQTNSSDLAIYESAVEEALLEIDGISETFDALLRISEIEAGARKRKFVDVELNSLLINIVDALEAVAEEQDQQLTGLIGNTPATVHGDRKLLNQLFINLVENAILHCPSGAQISVELAADGGHPTVKVRDTGAGIPPEEREKVFRRLYRLEKSRAAKGSGLGLSLVSAIAELHSAKVTLADNNPGLIVEVAFPQQRTVEVRKSSVNLS
jgi:signal transduction histidine kinase